jgi:hypothetical protein
VAVGGPFGAPPQSSLPWLRLPSSTLPRGAEAQLGHGIPPVTREPAGAPGASAPLIRAKRITVIS